MPVTIPINCVECGSEDIRVIEVATHLPTEHRERVQKVAGKYRAMCDMCGYAWAIYTDSSKHDSGKSHKKLRDQLSNELVNFIRSTVGKKTLTEE